MPVNEGSKVYLDAFPVNESQRQHVKHNYQHRLKFSSGLTVNDHVIEQELAFLRDALRFTSNTLLHIYKNAANAQSSRRDI